MGEGRAIGPGTMGQASEVACGTRRRCECFSAAISAPPRALWSGVHGLSVAHTAREVLNELKWRKGFDLSRAEIWVADRRHPGGSRVLSGAEIREMGHRYFTTARAAIPFYKIVKITYGGKVLFERGEGPAST